jgi:membrane dipeptidase
MSREYRNELGVAGMSWEYLHQISQPFSVVFAVTGVGVGIAGWLLDRESAERFAIVSLVLAGVFVLPAFVTGLAAGDVEASRTFVERSPVTTHRIWSIWATVGLVIAGTLATFSLLQADDRRLRRFVILVSVLAAAAVSYAGYVGLLIRHGSGGPVARLEAATVDTVDERARRVHARAIVVDAHNDLPWRIREQGDLDVSRLELETRSAKGHTDIPRLREGGVDVQFWAAYVPVWFIDAGATAIVLEQIDLIKRLAEAHPDDLEMAYSTADIDRIVAEGKIASLIGIEGGQAISNSLPVLRELYRAGARYMTLTHTRTLPWADAAGDTAIHGGLTPFGRQVVGEMNRLGMLVDLSHVTAEVMLDALEASEAPVIFSHSSARAVADHPRNVPDRVLRKVAKNGGVVMVNFFSGYIDHIVRVAGIDHVGLGSDFDGVAVLPKGLEDVSRLPVLTSELLERGYSEEDVLKVLGGNLLRVFRRVEEVAARLQSTTPPGLSRLPYVGQEPDRAVQP